MVTLRSTLAAVLVGMCVALALPASAGAVEYRLKVASVFDPSLTSFLAPGELNDGATGPGFQKLSAFLDEGSGDRGMIVTQRPLAAVPESIARAWGGVSVTAPIARGGVTSYWDEVRWDGKPGERSIWIVKADGRMRPQTIKHVVLGGTTPLSIEQPYSADCGKVRLPVLKMPIPLMAFQERRGDVWDKYVAKSLDMRHGVGVVVGTNSDAVLPDLAYIIVQQGPEPTTFEVVLSWGSSNAESPGGGFGVLGVDR
jgi:hypothetical protein